jgi:hypothetical protein
MDLAIKALEIAHALFEQYKRLGAIDDTARRLSGRVENVCNILGYHNWKGSWKSADDVIKGCLSRLVQALCWLADLTRLYEEEHRKGRGFFKGACTKFKDFFQAHHKLGELEGAERMLEKELQDLQLALSLAIKEEIHAVGDKQNMVLANQHAVARDIGCMGGNVQAVYVAVQDVRQQQQTWIAQNTTNQQVIAGSLGGIHGNLQAVHGAVQDVRVQLAEQAKGQVGRH